MCVLFAVQGLYFPAHAATETAVDAASRWGLLGTWAPDCSKPASSNNAFFDYIQKGPDLQLHRDSGDDSDTSTITAAVLGSDGTIEITIDLTKFLKVYTLVLAKSADGRYRVMSTHDETGAYSVKGGLLNGKPTKWLTRCR
jgi:hypothetical protein